MIAGLGGAVAWLRAARAQTAGVKRVGVIYQGGPYEVSIEGLRDGLKAAGLDEGRHVALFRRNVNGTRRPRKRRRAPRSVMTRST